MDEEPQIVVPLTHDSFKPLVLRIMHCATASPIMAFVAAARRIARPVMPSEYATGVSLSDASDKETPASISDGLPLEMRSHGITSWSVSYTHLTLPTNREV